MKTLLVFLFCFFFSLSVYAGKAITVGITDWPPFMFAQKPPYRGVSVDVIKEVARRANLPFEIISLPWSRIVFMLKNGTLDCVSSIFKNEERQKFVSYTDAPYFNLTTVFYIAIGPAKRVQVYDDLLDLTVGVVAETEYFDPFNKDLRIRKHQVNREEQLFKLLDQGRVDAIIGTYPQIEYDIQLRGYGGKFKQTKYKPGNDVGLYIGCSKASPAAAHIKIINEVLATLRSEGFVNDTVARYINYRAVD